MRFFMMVVYLVLIILGVSFAALNASTVQVNLYFTTFSIPLSVLLIIVLGVGVIIGLFLFMFRYFRLQTEYRRLRGQLALTEKEIKNLRSIPLQDQH